MVRHIVLFKFKNKEKDLETAREMLLAIPDKVKGCSAYEVGVNTTDSPFAYDLALNSAFENEERLAAYAGCPEHQRFLEFIAEAAASIAETNFQI